MVNCVPQLFFTGDLVVHLIFNSLGGKGIEFCSNIWQTKSFKI